MPEDVSDELGRVSPRNSGTSSRGQALALGWRDASLPRVVRQPSPQSQPAVVSLPCVSVRRR
jgi:hypothetical protein